MRPELTVYWAKDFWRYEWGVVQTLLFWGNIRCAIPDGAAQSPRAWRFSGTFFSKGIGRWLKMMWLQKYKDFFGMDIYPLRSMTLLLCLFLKGQNLQNSKTLGRLVCATWYTRWSRSAWSIGSDQFWIPFASTLMALLVPEKQNFRFCMLGCPCCTCSC